MAQPALIMGKVEYREGDGANIKIRPGPCEVEMTALDATISWSDGPTHGSTVIPLADFKHHLASKAIELIGSASA